MTAGSDAATIESLAAYFRSSPSRLGVSYIIQKNGRMGSIGDFFAETWHVKSHNSECIGVEQIGSASISRAGWAFRKRQTVAAGWLAAWVSQQLEIPLVRCAENRRWTAPSGFCQHADVPDNDHTDCGPGYPFDMVLRRAELFREHGVPLWARLLVPGAAK
jgi:hypothetical protein